jgi:hypothetical protein
MPRLSVDIDHDIKGFASFSHAQALFFVCFFNNLPKMILTQAKVQ